MNIYIVDDEKNIRDSIVKNVPFSEYGINTIICAANGLDALEKMKVTPPDIVLCDIRMPKMDGIALAQNMKELFENYVIIFFSGYDDKEYLKSAIQLGVFEYIEKPIALDELKATIQNAAKKKLSLTGEKSPTLKAGLIKQDIARQIFQPNGLNTPSVLQETMLQYPLCQSSHLTVLCFQFFENPSNGADLRSILTQHLASDDLFPELIYGMLPDSIFAILADERNFPIDKIIDQFSEFLRKFSTAKFNVGVSCSHRVVSQAYSLYQEAYVALNNAYYLSNLYTVYKSSAPGEKIPQHFAEQFQDAIAKPDKTATLATLSSLEQYCLTTKPCIKSVITYYDVLYQSLYHTTRSQKRILLHYMPSTEAFHNTLVSFSAYKSLHQYLTEYVAQYFDFAITVSGYTPRVQLIMHYMQENLQDPQLSIRQIADATGLNPSYLCFYFKKQTGITVNQYLTKIRIDYAKYLLMHSGEKIYDIAIKCGFSDTNYFSALFHKQTALTPSEYRKAPTHE